MTDGHMTYQLHFSLISEMQEMAATMRLANEVPHGHGGGARTMLVRGSERSTNESAARKRDLRRRSVMRGTTGS